MADDMSATPRLWRLDPLPCDQGPGNPSPCKRCGATYANRGCPEKTARYDRLAACHDELVEALEPFALESWGDFESGEWTKVSLCNDHILRARAALARAQGEKS